MTIYYKKSEKKANQGRVILGAVILCLIFILGIVYLVETNTTIAATYQLMSRQKALQNKQEANQELGLELVRVQSLPYLSEIFKGLNMVSIGKSEYLQPYSDQVAKAD